MGQSYYLTRQTICLTLLSMKSVAILLYLLGIVGWRVSGRAQAGTLKSAALGRTTQMIVVTTSDVERVSDAVVSRYL